MDLCDNAFAPNWCVDGLARPCNFLRHIDTIGLRFPLMPLIRRLLPGGNPLARWHCARLPCCLLVNHGSVAGFCEVLSILAPFRVRYEVNCPDADL